MVGFGNRLRTLLATAALFAAAVLPVAAQQRTQTFEISSQPLSNALVEFSRASGVVVVAPSALLAGRRAPAVQGDFTPDAALQRLLAGSGLEPQLRPEGGIALVVSSDARSRPSLLTPSAPLAPPQRDIVVTGERLDRTAQAYAEAIALAPSGVDQYARWNGALCPSVAGLAPADAQTLIDHIARRAYEVGVRVSTSGCEANAVIIFAPDSDRLAREVVESRGDLLGFYDDDNVITAGRAGIRDFADIPRPVRWWHVSHTAAADGQDLGVQGIEAPRPASPGEPIITDFEGVRAVRFHPSRMRRPTRQEIRFTLIIVDTERVAGAAAPAVADYLAMAALIQLDPDADMSRFSSILNLFAQRSAGEPAPVGMTVWDLAYLQGLYRAAPDAASARQQRREIARRMVEHVALE